MTPEEFVQRGYFDVLTAAKVPVFDTLPTKSKLPAVIFGNIRCLDQKCCHSVVEVVLNVISADTSKKKVYDLAAKVEKILAVTSFQNENYTLGFLNFKSSEFQVYRPDSNQQSGGEIWQLGIIKYTNFVSKKCGQK